MDVRTTIFSVDELKFVYVGKASAELSDQPRFYKVIEQLEKLRAQHAASLDIIEIEENIQVWRETIESAARNAFPKPWDSNRTAAVVTRALLK